MGQADPGFGAHAPVDHGGHDLPNEGSSLVICASAVTLSAGSADTLVEAIARDERGNQSGARNAIGRECQAMVRAIARTMRRQDRRARGVNNEEPTGELTLRTMAMPADTNASGDIFGGWVLSQMDLAGGIAAGQRASARVVTIAVDKMKFIRPVQVGDVLCVYAEVVRVGNTSMEIRLEAWALRHRYGQREMVTEAVFTFVAVDESGKPRPVPKG